MGNKDLEIADVQAWGLSFPVSSENSVRLGVGQALKRDAVVVKVTTKSGIVGWGESHHGRAPSTIAHFINFALRPVLIKQDASNVNGIWQMIYKRQLAAMGIGLPAAIAAKLLYPSCMSICFAGDGCFLMTGQELATAVQYKANIIVVIVNNGMYGSIRMHQERHYPGNVWATDLGNPDFVELARSYGAYAERVQETSEFEGAFKRAVSSNKPAVIELITDKDILTPRMTIQDMRAASAK